MLSEKDLDDIAKEEGIEPAQLKAILAKENSKDSDISSAGAMGRGQLLKTTFDSMLPGGDINNPVDNVRAAARYIKQGLEKTGGDFQKAAAYYYGGPNWDKKVAQAPGKKYGTNPDGSAGISIEDYASQAAKHLSNYGGSMSMEEFMASSFSPGEGVDPSARVRKLGDEADTQLEGIQKSQASLSDRIKANVEKQTAGVRREGELAATVKLNEFEQQARRAGENAAVLSKLGINTSDIDSLVAQIASDLASEYQVSQEKRSIIERKQNTTFFDDPAEWFKNQLTIQQDVREHNQIVERMASQKAYVDKATGVASSVAAVNAAKFTTVSLAGAQAGADLLRQQAEDKALALEEKGLALDYDKQIKAFTVTQARIANINATVAAEQQAGVRRTVTEAKAKEAERVSADNQSVNIAGKMLGLDVPDRKTLDKSPKDIKQAVEYIMANGGNIGKDPMEAWEVLARGNFRKMPPAVAYQRNMLDTVKQQAEDNLSKNALVATMNPKQKKEALSTEMSRMINHASMDPNYSVMPSYNGIVENPYHVPALDTMSKLPDVRGLTLTKLLDLSKTTLPNKQLTDNYILEVAYAGVGKQYADITEAARDVANYYRAGVTYNNDTFHFENFGMNPQTSYKVGKTDYTRTESVLKVFLDKERMAYGTARMGEIYAP